jgi:hypothetical protein
LTGFSAGSAVLSLSVLRVATVTVSRSAARVTVVVAATRLARLPEMRGVVVVLALAVRVASASAAMAPRMIALIRTIRPPCGVIAF